MIVVNGRPYAFAGDARTSLLDFLREEVGLTGPKPGCNQGGCGACTVLLDGRRILSCLMLAVQSEGRAVTTIEGPAPDGAFHALQAAFIAHDGFQCGYCTPGQICSAIGMVEEVRQAVPSSITCSKGGQVFDPADIRERMSGNLCRCGAYNGIVAAIAEVFGGEAGA